MDVSQEQPMQLYIEQHIYKHNLVNYNMCKGHTPLPVFQKILLESDFLASCFGIPPLNYIFPYPIFPASCRKVMGYHTTIVVNLLDYNFLVNISGNTVNGIHP